MIIDRIYKSFAQTIYLQEHEIYIGSSMGISIYPDNGKDIATLLKNADIALYHAKSTGRNHFQYYSAELNQSILDAYKKEAELQRAIDNKELCLYYQPIFDACTMQILSFEALLRWHHPQRGLLTAAEIIPVAEKSGLIVQIGKWALTAVCQQARIWENKNLPVIPIGVNISLLQIKNTSLEKMVSNALEKNGLETDRIELELTETSYNELSETVLKDMQILSDKGVKLIVDDFGVGYSGLGHLRSLPVSKLKIDQSFIKTILEDADDRAITLAIIAIAHQLDLQVIAEGVETAAQFEFLKIHNVDAAQGNFLSKPLDVMECEVLLRKLTTTEVI